MGPASTADTTAFARSTAPAPPVLRWAEGEESQVKGAEEVLERRGEEALSGELWMGRSG
jgi:hypothetical protein